MRFPLPSLVLLAALFLLNSKTSAQDIAVSLNFTITPYTEPADPTLGFKFYGSPDLTTPPASWLVLANVLANTMTPVIEGESATFSYTFQAPINFKYFAVSSYDSEGESPISETVTFDCGIAPPGTQFIPCGPVGPCYIEAFALTSVYTEEVPVKIYLAPDFNMQPMPDVVRLEHLMVMYREYEIQFCRSLTPPIQWIALARWTAPKDDTIITDCRIYPCDPTRFFRVMQKPITPPVIIPDEGMSGSKDPTVIYGPNTERTRAKHSRARGDNRTTEESNRPGHHSRPR